MNRKKIRAVIGMALFLPICVAFAYDKDIFDRANDLLQEQKYAEAVAMYERFIDENPEHRLVPAAMWTMANVSYTINQDYSQAALIYQIIIREHADTGWEIFSHDRLGLCYEEQERWSEAAHVYKSILQQLETERRYEMDQDWVNVFKVRLIAAYRNLNDRESMVSILQESLANDPAGSSAPEDQFDLGRVYLEMDDVKKAAEHFAMLVDRYPFSNPARSVQNEYADMLARELDYEWAPFTRFQSCVRLSQTGHYEEALEGFDGVIADKRNTGMEYAARFQKELVEFRKNGDAQALRDKLAANQADYPYGFGGVRAEPLLDVLDRIIEAKATINADPDGGGAHGTMGFAYYQLQAYHPGIDSYKKAISVDPDNTALYYNMLGYCYIGVEAYDDAIATFQQLIDASPEDPNSYDSMAEGHYIKGDTTMAIQYYQQSLSIDSSFSHPYYMLGEIHIGVGQNDKARNYLERYLELDPEGFRAQAAQDLLIQITEEQE